MGTISNEYLDAEVMMQSGDTERTRNKADNSYIGARAN